MKEKVESPDGIRDGEIAVTIHIGAVETSGLGIA